MHVESLGEIVPPPSHNTVGVCNQVVFLILYYITSRLVPLPKATDAPIQVPNVLDLTVNTLFKIALSLRMTYTLSNYVAVSEICHLGNYS